MCKINLNDDEMGELKEHLLYFVKRVTHRIYDTQEEVQILPEIVELLLGNVDMGGNFDSGS